MTPPPILPWSVAVLWRPRTTRLRQSWDARRARRQEQRDAARPGRRSRWYDNLDPTGGLDLDGLLLLVGAVLAVLAIWFLLIPALLVVLDLVVLLLLTLLLVPLRVLLRRPWTVLAVAPDGSEHRYPVVGWRRAHRTAAALHAHLLGGGSPPRPGELAAVVRVP